MRPLALALAAGLFLAGCEKCTEPALVAANVGVGAGGTTGGVAVGKSCGGSHITIGFGNGYYLGW